MLDANHSVCTLNPFELNTECSNVIAEENNEEVAMPVAPIVIVPQNDGSPEQMCAMIDDSKEDKTNLPVEGSIQQAHPSPLLEFKYNGTN